MRFRLPMKRTVFFLSAFAFALVALIPLRVAAGWFGSGGLAAREANGSIWLGVLKEAQFGPVALGDVSARLNVLPLLIGRARLSLSRDEAQGAFEGALSVSRHSFALEDLTGQIRTGTLFAPVPVGALDLDDVSVQFANGSCESADGRVRASVSGEMGGIPLPGSLGGDVRCAQGALLVPLASQGGMGQLNLAIRADGTYRIDLVIRQTDPSLAPRLTAAGFQLTGAGYTRRIEGHF